jgi:phage shock protein PspC (stress-responsive transcriptional regulator)
MWASYDAEWSQQGISLATASKERPMNDIRQFFARHGLVRSRDHRVLGGVAAGLGRRFGLAPWTARLLFVLLLLVIPGSQLLVYPILWIVMPLEQTVDVPFDRAAASPAA